MTVQITLRRGHISQFLETLKGRSRRMVHAAPELYDSTARSGSSAYASRNNEISTDETTKLRLGRRSALRFVASLLVKVDMAALSRADWPGDYDLQMKLEEDGATSLSRAAYHAEYQPSRAGRSASGRSTSGSSTPTTRR